MLPDCLSIDFQIGQDYFHLNISNPTIGVLSPKIVTAQAKLVEAIGHAHIQIRAASQHCGFITMIPYCIVIKPVREELEKEFAIFREIVETHGNGMHDLYRLGGNSQGFVKSWKFVSPHKHHPKFYVLSFCCLEGKCWFGPPSILKK